MSGATGNAITDRLIRDAHYEQFRILVQALAEGKGKVTAERTHLEVTYL